MVGLGRRMLVRKDLLEKLIDIATQSAEYLNAKDENIKWITVKGNHIPIKKGQTEDEAVKAFLSKVGDDSVKYYSEMGYADINNYLRGNQKTISEKSQNAIKSLDNKMNENILSSDKKVYRYLAPNFLADTISEDLYDIQDEWEDGNITEENIKQYKNKLIGKTFEEKGFMSTTTNPKNIENKPFKMEINLNKGTKGLNIESDSKHKEENEFLVNRGTKIKIKDVKIEIKDKRPHVTLITETI